MLSSAALKLDENLKSEKKLIPHPLLTPFMSNTFIVI